MISLGETPLITISLSVLKDFIKSSNFLKLVVLVGLLAIVACKSDSGGDSTIDLDSDGDGITDEQEELNGTNKNNPCDPKPTSGYTGYDANSTVWLAADCDIDGISNAQELTDGSDPFLNESKDSDGDGIPDYLEVANGSDENNPCDPLQEVGYDGYNALNSVWAASDCDADGVSNGDEVSASTNPYLDDTVYAVAEFLPKLSELKLFRGNIGDLLPNPTTHEYSLSTPLYSDYAYKFRTISLPEGAQMTYDGSGLLQFPDNTVITKTFYYYNDERNFDSGRKLIETRLLIKKNGVWTMGNYLWNEEQTEANLSNSAPTVPVNWIDGNGASQTVNYQVPFSINCTQCHNVNSTPIPIGPKARNLNFEYNGQNQLQYFIDKGLLTGVPALSEIERLPAWDDSNFSLAQRARAYMDVNCAHCHQPGGNHNANTPGRPDFRYEVSLADGLFVEFKDDIKNRTETLPAYGPSMPQIGITEIHTEGIDLIHQYMDTL
ncbi:hypothetical protein [Cytophaga sp. FL35]|uniref:hypothetical protein n=1 Tax=Cytophaga sp. FL35 TaxID=1904456 RepID=UPI00165392BA|nr:hypothetical protein [Cytophaga sp. FL35]MBC6998170.1 hypothetical protein [Cytophaga sp. FL35]